ncbi:amino acid transporter [Arthrobacter woluwensis]|uniref:APC family permease n=1 Tax=Arthrobacter woluwensis TaxID=156980 RepID=UPI00277EF91F|nr:APC family permease [Arthrobacter woluwensis]MDQ0709750.1 amino acid transporter [Arthrobacter woluwensis]
MSRQGVTDGGPSAAVAVTPKGLRAGILDLGDLTMLGMASTAPVFALSVTLGLIVSRVGDFAPLALLLGFAPVLLVALAFRELNAREPDCGTSFTWVRRAFGPYSGWAAGFATAVASVVVLVNLGHVAAQYLWALISRGSWEVSPWLTVPTALVIMAAMCWVNSRGIRMGENVQRTLTYVQYIALGVLAIALVVGVVRDGAAEVFHWGWFDLGAALQDPSRLGQGVLLAIFLFWGWDTCFSLNEESDDPSRTPGRGALLSTVALVLVYLALTVLLMMFASTDTNGIGLGNPDNSGDVMGALRETALGPWGWVVLVSLLGSILSGAQATVLPVTRSLLAMGRQGALPARLGSVEPATQAPRTVSWVVFGAAGVYYLVLTFLGANVMIDSANAVTVFIAFYYAVTAFACVWTFRHTLRDSARNLWLRGILPLLGGVLLTVAFVSGIIQWAKPEFSQTAAGGVGGTLVVVLVLAVLGIGLLLWARFSSATRAYFTSRAS